jgi:hypothetical protein
VSIDAIKSYHFFKIKPSGKSGRVICYRNSGSPHALQQTIEFAVNECIRAELRILGLVSNGSTRRISKLTVNEGVARKNWKNSNGNKWSGAGLTTVKIRKAQFRLFKVTIPQ